MGFLLKDIIDLEFLLSLDEQGMETGEEGLSARDRDIFRQIRDPDPGEGNLIREWLSFRKLLFFHQTSPEETLPGALFAALMGWSARLLFAGGLFLGLAAATTFLAYHGTRPINVTIFISLFMLLQALVSCIAFAVMTRQALGPGLARPGFFQTLISGLFFKKLGALYRRAAEMPGGKTLKAVQGAGRLLGNVNKAHRGIMFWPFFILSSLLALGFSCGALGGTLFRVAVSDLAFGWQSTLVPSGEMVHHLVNWMALPWSWALPSAVPGPEQIEGSRIILKEGIAGLATEHLTAWWPFLCMGLLVYGVILRLAVAALAWRAQASALAHIDLDQPRFRRLLVRMRSPNMETRTSAGQGAAAENRPMPPRPDEVDLPEAAGRDRTSGSPLACRLLASEQACPGKIPEAVVALVEGQLGVAVRETALVSFDFEEDRKTLASLVAGREGEPVIFLQEVWQPPIRGLLHYYTRVATEAFPHSPVWILLIGTPGEGAEGVSSDEVNYRVWKKAVSKLALPDLVLERILP